MLFDPSQPKAGFLERMRSLFLGMSAVLIMGLILFVIAFLVNQPTPEQEKRHKMITAREDFLRSYVDLSVIEAGYLRRSAGAQVVYVPAVFVRINNLSEKTLDKLFLRVVFYRDDTDICEGSALVAQLRPGESYDAALRCLKLTGMGTLFQGLSLIQTIKPVDYRAWVTHENVTMALPGGQFEFTLIE